MTPATRARLQGLVKEWREEIAVEQQRIAECYKLPYDLRGLRVFSAKLEVMTKWADALAARLAAEGEGEG